ncbi:MAG: LuxR C-terminal-related transcriptional regulator, partial [Gaiellaceae bacterium]
TGASGIEGLTARELEIARLVVDRQTNTQIAAALYLSKKTVETHLRNIFAKVLVSSRVELAREVERARAAAWADRTAAAVELAGGGAPRAAERALASAAAADAVGAPVEAALSRALAGRALAQASDVEGAVAELQRAARDFETCGALRHRDDAERELRKLGQHIHRRTRAGKANGTGIESLTEREEQVVRLVVDRKTNPEIAADLFLSQKTVETHLRNIFRKVGVASRVELARAVERAHRAV